MKQCLLLVYGCKYGSKSGVEHGKNGKVTKLKKTTNRPKVD